MLTSTNPFEEEYQRAADLTPSASHPLSSAAAGSDILVQTATGADMYNGNRGFGASAAAAAAAASADASPPSQTHPGSYERVVLARFRVDAPFKGSEMIRPITYFPITTDILESNDASFTVPDIPSNGPHLSRIDIGVKRTDWTRGNSAMVERRYSEVADLRELLTYQFPTLIIPPLPAKSNLSSIETYFSASDALTAQRHNLQFFLREIAAMPELIFFSEWVAPFFLDPRDTFETGTLLHMRAALRMFRSAARPFHECSKRHRSFTEYTANKLASQSSKLVRSVAGLFFSSASSPSAAAAAGTARDEAILAESGHAAPGLNGGWSSGSPLASQHHANPSMAAPTPLSVSSSSYDWAYLPPSAKSDAAAWVQICETLQRRQQSINAAACAFEKYLTSLHQKSDAQLKVAQSFEEYEATLRQTPSFTQLGDYYHLAVLLMDTETQKEKDSTKGKYLNVCLRLAFESHLIDAVLDTVDALLGQYQYLSNSQLMGGSGDQLQQELLSYTMAVSAGLRQDYVSRYRAQYTRRMKNLIREQIIRPSMDTAVIVAETANNSALLRVVQENGFTAIDDANGAA